MTTLPIDQPNVFLLGCQKCATTWLHRALGEHPELFVAQEDELHYFDANYTRGRAWYERFFEGYAGQRWVADTTSSYIRDPRVPARIKAHNPHAKLIVAVRNPIERAFSHYWHEKRKGRIGSAFEDLFRNYDLFQSWVVTGFYADHLGRLREHFSADQVLVVVHDDLAVDATAFIQGIYRFIGVDASFVPEVINRKFNVGVRPAASVTGPQPPGARWLDARRWWPGTRRQPVAATAPAGPTEYEQGIKPQTHEQLRAIFEPEVRRLEKMLGRDLSHWLRPAAVTTRSAA